MFQLIVRHQGIEKVTIQLEDTPTKVHAIILSKMPLEVLQNWLLIQLLRVTPHIFEQGKKSFQTNTGFRLLSLHSLLFLVFLACRSNWLMNNQNKKLVQKAARNFLEIHGLMIFRKVGPKPHWGSDFRSFRGFSPGQLRVEVGRPLGLY